MMLLRKTCTRANRVQIATDAPRCRPGRPWGAPSSPGTRLAHLGRRCARACTAVWQARVSALLIPSEAGRRQLSRLALAMAREPAAFRSLLIRPGAVRAGPGAILARLVRGWLALACVRLA